MVHPIDSEDRSKDHIDPVCGMTGVIPAHGRWFCGKNCVRKYEDEHGLAHIELVAAAVKPDSWYKNRLFVVAAVLSMAVALSYGIGWLVPFRKGLFDYLRMIFLPVLAGFVFGGVIDYYVPRTYVSKLLAYQGKRTIFRAVGLGFLMSACSHGILALSIELYRKGASVPAVVSFLLASPWANLPVTILLFGFFGWKAFAIVVLAMIIAVLTGLVYQELDRRGMIEKNPNTSVSIGDGFSILGDIQRRWKSHSFSFTNVWRQDVPGIINGAGSLAGMVLWWILIGIGVASAAGAYIPHGVFHNYMGPTFTGLLAVLVMAAVLEVCSEGTAPLAFEVYKQTRAFGNTFAFLMGGVVTDYTEIGLLWTNIGPKTAIWLPVISLPQTIFWAVILNKMM